MHLGKSQSEHIDEFQKLVGDLAAIDTSISDEDQALLLLTSLPSSYDNFVETFLYSRDTLKLEDVLATLNSREPQKMTEAKGDGGEGLYVRGRSGIVSGIIIRNLKVVSVLKIMYPVLELMEYDGGNILLGGDGKECRVRGTCKVQVHMRDGSSFMLDNVRYVMELRQNLISIGTLEKECFTVKMQSGKIKVIKGSLVVLSGTRRANCVYTLDGQLVTRKTLKGRKQLGEYQTGWKIKTGNVLDSCNQRSTQQCTKSGVAKHLGVAGLQQQNGLSGLSKVLWAEDTTISTYLVNKVLQGVEFEVEQQEDHTFEVEPHGNVDHVAGLQGVQTQDLIYYHLARDREQHSTRELFNYREDSNDAAFAVAEAEKIYAHESLTFNNTVACEMISKWKAGLKDDMDARSDVYVLSNGCKKCSDDNDVYYWEYTPGMFIHLFLYIDDMGFSCGCRAEIWATKGLLDKAKGNILGMKIVKDQSGNTLRVS
ncbi:hypothetical protein Tco_0963609 [Tanacetum coccineum]